MNWTFEEVCKLLGLTFKQVAEIQEMVEYKEWGDEINPQNNSLKVKN